MQFKRAALLAGVLLGGALAAYSASGADGPNPDHSYGYILTDLSPAFHKGKDSEDCPDGLSLTTRESFLASQPPAERTRLLQPENAEELTKKFTGDFVYDSKGRSICTHPEAFDRPPQQPYQGKVAYGMDLDGHDGSGAAPESSCAHGNFESPAGETGIDNQYHRATACNRFWRGAEGAPWGDMINSYKRWRRDPVNSIVIVLRGVDDWRNDENVEFILSYSPDAAPIDNQNKHIEGASFTLTEKPEWRQHARARIRDGVLMTDPMDINSYTKWIYSHGRLHLRDVRFRMEVLPNGELKGIAGAYWPLTNVFDRQKESTGYATASGIECAAVYKTLTVLADGHRNPSTGMCTSISVGLTAEAKPAYIFEDERMVAQAWNPPRSLLASR